MRSILLLSWCVLVASIPHWVNGQCSDTTFYSTQDTWTTTQNPTGNYWNHVGMKSGTAYITGRNGISVQYHQRIFVEFDVSSIPSNAIITSATMKLTRNGSISGSFDWKTKLITESWDDNLVTASNEPAISILSGDVTSVTATSASVQEMDVTDMVQRMVYGAATNNGWCVQVNNEAASANTGCYFFTSEYTTVASRPQLEIEYYLPVTLSNVVISHESAIGADDGSITLNHSCFDDQGYTYSWIDANGNSAGSTSSTVNLTDVPFGWYGLEVTGSGNGEKEYFGFLVGTECEEVTIAYTTSPEYTSNAYINDWVTSGGIDYKDYNYGNNAYFRTDNRNSTTWYDVKSYLDFNTWMDDAFTINQADLLLDGYSHSNSGTTNTAQFNEVTSYWNEEVITWNTDPTNNTTLALTIPNTTSSTQDLTLDMESLWNSWKLDNSGNYGVLFQLQAFDDDFNTNQIYYSPNASSANRPQWTFKLELNHFNNPIFCEGAEGLPYNELKKQLDGGYGESYNDTLNFVLDESYEVGTGLYLVTSIFNDDNELEASCDAAGTTVDGMPALTYEFDDNRYVMDLSGIAALVDGEFYVLEVKNTKGDRFYLKFKHNE